MEGDGGPGVAEVGVGEPQVTQCAPLSLPVAERATGFDRAFQPYDLCPGRLPEIQDEHSRVGIIPAKFGSESVGLPVLVGPGPTGLDVGCLLIEQLQPEQYAVVSLQVQIIGG